MAEWPFQHVASKLASGKTVESLPRSLLGDSRSRLSGTAEGVAVWTQQGAGSRAHKINFIKPNE